PTTLWSSSVTLIFIHRDVKPVADFAAELESPLTEPMSSAVWHVSGELQLAAEPSPGGGAESTGAAAKPGPGSAATGEDVWSLPASTGGVVPPPSSSVGSPASSTASPMPLVAHPPHDNAAMGRATAATANQRIGLG